MFLFADTQKESHRSFGILGLSVSFTLETNVILWQISWHSKRGIRNPVYLPMESLVEGFWKWNKLICLLSLLFIFQTMWFLAKIAVNRTFPDIVKNLYRNSGTESMLESTWIRSRKSNTILFHSVTPDQSHCQEPQGNHYSGVWFVMCLLKSVDVGYWQVFKTWHSVWICIETWLFWTSLIWTICLDENCSAATFVIFAGLLTMHCGSSTRSLAVLLLSKKIFLPEHSFQWEDISVYQGNFHLHKHLLRRVNFHSPNLWHFPKTQSMKFLCAE